jgi:hypothetical protein
MARAASAVVTYSRSCGCVTNDLNTLLTALYVLVDDRVGPPRSGRGRRPELTDSELITLATAQVLLRYDSERRWIRHLHADPRGVNGVLACLASRLSQAVEGSPTVAVQDDSGARDVLPVLGRRHVDHRRHPGPLRDVPRDREALRLGRTRQLWLLCVTFAMVLGVEALPRLRRRRDAGQVLLADKGFAGKEFKQLTEAMRVGLLRPDRRDETYRNGNLGGVRPDRIGQPDPQRPTGPRSARRTHPARRVHPSRAAPTGHGAAQLDHRPDQQTITDRVRPLTSTSRNQPSREWPGRRPPLDDPTKRWGLVLDEPQPAVGMDHAAPLFLSTPPRPAGLGGFPYDPCRASRRALGR